MENFNIINGYNNRKIKAWTKGVPFEHKALEQLMNVTQLPFIHEEGIAVMPDVHVGRGATIGSVIPTVEAIIPAAVGVDIGCGMMAVQTTLNANDIDGKLKDIRNEIERLIPHGRTSGRSKKDRGFWGSVPKDVAEAWAGLDDGFQYIKTKHKSIGNSNNVKHLGSLGSGNHFIEVCLDESDGVWFMLHSGSRGVGNKIGQYFIELARKDMMANNVRLPDIDLAYLKEGTQHFDDYVFSVEWAQNFARKNREIMMNRMIKAVRNVLPIPFLTNKMVVNCHHNYISREHHFGKDCFITRKGAVKAGENDYGIIPGSMGAKSFIVKGKGNKESYETCSHGAGRVYSRTKAKELFTMEDHMRDTEGVECRKDKSVIDETPKAYKSIDDVMNAQSDLVNIVHTLKQVVCVKG
jgi:tRNA-splicing ligase RtcB